MSWRVRKKLFGATPPLLQEPIQQEDLVPNNNQLQPSRSNMFTAFEESDPSEAEDEGKMSEDDGQPRASCSKNKPKRKKKKNKKTRCSESEVDNNLQDIDAILEEINNTFGTPEVAQQGSSKDDECCSYKDMDEKSLFNVTRHHLHYVNELTMIFGAETLQEEHWLRRDRFGSILCHRTDPWPNITQTRGMKMMMLGKVNDMKYFYYEHSEPFKLHMYQMMSIQHYGDAYEVFAEDNYNIGAILQLLEINYNMPEQIDDRLVELLLERALLILESCFHGEFRILTGSVRLEYRFQSNRILYALLFKKMLRCARFICYRSALEYAKLIRSLDEEDCLGMVLCLDYYAIKSHQYDWLINAMKKTIHHPNVLFSVALAKYHLDKTDEKRECTELLIKAICMYPEMTHVLLEKIHTKYGEDMEQKAFFKEQYEKLPICTLKTISLIYVENMVGVWREVKDWFTSAMRTGYAILKNPNNTLDLETMNQKFLRCANIIPFSFIRYCVLNGEEIGQHIMQYPIATEAQYMDRFWWDPFPPKISEVVYMRSVVNNTVYGQGATANVARRLPGLQELQMFLFGAAAGDNRQ